MILLIVPQRQSILLKGALSAVALACATLGAVRSTQSQEQPECERYECPDGFTQDHDDGQFQFSTSSRSYGDSAPFTFETCVKNKGTNDLDFNWIIPGPRTWIPSGCAVVSPRAMQTNAPLNSSKGCAIYGNSGKTNLYEFIPHESDQPALDSQRDCSIDYSELRDFQPELLPKVSKDADETRDWLFSISGEVFAPTNLQDIRSSMARIRYSVTFESHEGKGQYFRWIRYTIDPAYPANNTVAPELLFLKSPISTSQVYSTAGSMKDGLIPLSNKGEIELIDRIPTLPRLTSVHHDLVSGDGKVVATIWMPVLVENKAQN